MLGQQGGSQDKLFYSFNLDDHLPRNHLLRGLDRFFDLGELRAHLAPFYSHTGRPSIDPEDRRSTHLDVRCQRESFVGC